MTTLPRFLRDPGVHFFLFGPRGTGKTTWLKATHPDALWIDLLEPDVERELTARPEKLRRMVEAGAGPGVVIVDEVQRAPEVLTVVHRLMEDRKGHYRFILTGSNSRKLKRAHVDLLGGRALKRAMHPFLAAEIGPSFDLEKTLVTGMVPAVWNHPSPSEAIRAYLSLYIREEVKMEGLVRDLGGFNRFLEAVSFSHGGVLNLAAIARECEVGRSTVSGYLDVLEDLMLSFRLPVFTRRAKRHLTRHDKLYLFDAGVYRTLRPSGPLDQPEEMGGAALEGLVAQHLRAWIDYSQASLSLYYWRTKSGTEVDFVLYGSDGLFALEVKSHARVFPKDLRGLKAFREDYPMARVALLHGGPRPLLIDGIPCLPCRDFLGALVPGDPLPIAEA